ncbi:hypothetical protein M0R04_15045 [Candidatus Dojkabacteria bacterium]|jgi:hypothetical protein|nr:hypothetical protein [Candidatus Dojkabacteria bacterium]
MINVKCKQCKKEFQVYKSDAKRGRGKFCYPKCYGQWLSENRKGKNNPSWNGGKITVKCLMCNKNFLTFPSVIKLGRGKFCSVPCMGKWNSENLIGDKAMSWKGGITPINMLIRASIKYLEWARKIKERDNFTCQICGTTKAFFHSNHIKKFADYPELRTVLTNGITNCKECDYKFVMRHEELCEDFFNFNLIERGILI